MMGTTVGETIAAGATAVQADAEHGTARRRLADRLLPSAARTRIIGWVLLLVFTALGLVTFVTWRLLIAATDARMQQELRFEMQQFAELTAPGVNPRNGMPFASVDEVIREAIAYNVARPNEKFLGYVDGQYRAQSRPQVDGRATLAGNAGFAERVASITNPARGTYRHPQLGEVVYAAVPVTLAGDPARGVIVAAYLADAERTDADEAARLMLIVGAVTMLGAVAAAWLVAGRILRPLRDITETARTITDTDLSRRIPRRGGDGDELGDLVATVNGMLDRVETGVTAQRRFIDDAGHELRTPITIVRGHLEVLDPTDPDDVASTVALVDNELERMNRMVSDLLLLAQSEQPAFLRPDLVDVGALTREASTRWHCWAITISSWRRRPACAPFSIRSVSPRRWSPSPTMPAATPNPAGGSGSGPVSSTGGFGSGSPTRAAVSATRTVPGSSSASPAAARAAGNPTVPVWVWPSSAPSPSPTVATSCSTPCPGVAPRSAL